MPNPLRKSCSTATPWGRADDSTQLTRGVCWYSTPGHGGAGVTLAWAEKNLTAQAQELGERWGGKLWYAENCLCSVVFFEHPELEQAGTTGSTRTLDEIKASNELVVKRYWPHYFDPAFQRICRENPVVPPVQVGDYVKLTTKTYGPISEIDDNGNYLIGSGWAGYSRIRKSHVLECATEITRAGSTVWRRASAWWIKVQAVETLVP
jgi:hypothetical protein